MTMNEIASILRNQDHFAVVSHVNPDGDAVGSLLGMYLGLKEMGKQAWPLAREPLPDVFDFLPGREHVLIGSEAENITPHWIISLDVASQERISGSIESFRRQATLVNIDHHPSNPGFGDLNLVEPEATSTAELVFQLFNEAGHQVSADVAMCLYTGLITDTGGFRYEKVGATTLRLAAEMLESGFDAYNVSRHLFEEYPVPRLYLERIMLERVELLLDGRLIMSTLLAEDFEHLGAAMSDAENLVNRLREIRGVEAGVLIIQVATGVYRVSLRSKGMVNVASIAVALGGGGHRAAAGLRSELPLRELRERLINAVALDLDRGGGSSV